MRTKFINQMVEIDEEDFDLFDFLLSFVGVGCFDHDIQQLHVVDEYGVVEFLHFNDVVEVVVRRVESFDSLTFERLDDCVVCFEEVSEEGVFSGDYGRWRWGATYGNTRFL